MSSHIEKKLKPELRFPDFSEEWCGKRMDEVSKINPRGGVLPQEFIYIDLESVKKGQLILENKIRAEGAPSRAQRILKQGDILFQTVRPYQKNNYFFNKEGEYVASTGYEQLRVNGSAGFLYQYLYSPKFVDNVLKRCTGTNYPAINSDSFREIKINIPSLKEQQKIADFLTTVDKWIENTQKQKRLIELYKKGAVRKIFSQEVNFENNADGNPARWRKVKLNELLEYIQPTKYIVSSSEYSDFYKIPVLTPGKTFVLGYTNDQAGIFDATHRPIILFDDFTTANKFVDFKFKVKSSAVKILKNRDDNVSNIKFIFEAMQRIKFNLGDEHKRFWISEYSKNRIALPKIQEQHKIINFLTNLDNSHKLKSEISASACNFKTGLMQKMFI